MRYLVGFIDVDEFFLSLGVTVLVWVPIDYKRRRHHSIEQGSTM